MAYHSHSDSVGAFTTSACRLLTVSIILCAGIRTETVNGYDDRNGDFGIRWRDPFSYFDVSHGRTDPSSNDSIREYRDYNFNEEEMNELRLNETIPKDVLLADHEHQGETSLTVDMDKTGQKYASSRNNPLTNKNIQKSLENDVRNNGNSRLGNVLRLPPQWQTLNFTLVDGNRTINIRRFIRRPIFGSNNPKGRPIYLYRPVVYTPASTTTAIPPSSTQPPSSRNGSLSARILAAKRKLAKLLSLFTIIKFPNDACRTPEGVNGTCYHRLECKSLGGTAGGSCARGYGVCCVFQRTCGARTAQNCTYFVNPGYPQPSNDLMACILAVSKLPGAVQLRLDFLDFQIVGPVNGTCVNDQFVVSGQNINSIVPILCGVNTGQHVYLDVDDSSGPYYLSVLSMGGNFPRSFRVKVTQLKSANSGAAPRNCLQYYTGVTGTIESFNYVAPPEMTAGYMNNLNYAICIRKENGFCSITYINNAGVDSFQLVNVDEDGELLVPPGQAGAEAFNCPDDYVIINGVRLCGGRFNDASVQVDFTQNAPVTDTSNGPFIVSVRTNADTVGRGFRLTYMQNMCTS